MVGDRVVAAAGCNDVRAAAAVDGVVAGAAGDDVGARRARDRRADDSAEASTFWKLATVVESPVVWSALREVDVRRRTQSPACWCRCRRRSIFRCRNRTTRVVARAGIDDVGAAAAIDGVVAGAGRDGVGGGRAGDRRSPSSRADASTFSKFVTLDAVAGGLIDTGRDREIDRGGAAGSRQDERIVAGAAVDRRSRCRGR